MPCRRGLITIGSLLTAIAPALADFQPTSLCMVTNRTPPEFIAAGDLNGDGVPDLAVTFAATNQVQVFYRKQGTFAGVPDRLFPINRPGGVLILDADKDGTNDLAAVGIQHVYLFLGRERLAVEHKSFADTDQYERELIAGHLSANGLIDFLVGPTWKQWRGGDEFLKGYFYGGGRRMFMADLNHNGLTDVAMAPGEKGVWLCYAPFMAKKVRPLDLAEFAALSAPYPLNRVAVADMNGDQRPDILAQNEAQKELFVYYQNSPTGFHDQAPPSTNLNVKVPFLFKTADLNRDGLDDLIVVDLQHKKSSRLYVWIQNKATPLPQPLDQATQTLDLPDCVRVICVADMNGDGFPDLLTGASAPEGYGVLKVYLNSGQWSQGSKPGASTSLP